MDRMAQVEAAEAGFFAALLAGDRERLEAVLAPDFVLIDVMTGSEIPRAALVDLVGSRQLRFERIEHLESRVRLYGEMAIVTGATRMRGRFEEQAFEAHSRYTHAYAHGPDGWRLVTAQGTPIAAVPA